jgi:hypothetical protein
MANSRDFTGKNRKFTGTKGIVTPKGTTGQRVGEESGELRFNTTTELMEYYDGNAWKPIDAPPTITAITTSDSVGTSTVLNADGSTLFTITINGSNFAIGATVKFIGNTGTEYAAGNVTRVSGSQITCKTTSTMGTTDDPYDIQVANTSGLAALLEDAFSYNAPPVFTVASGQLGTVYNGQTISGTTLNAGATDAEGNSITHTIISGALPGSGLSISSSTGAITGTLSGTPSLGNYPFVVRASTTEGVVERQFSIQVVQVPPYTVEYLVIAGGGGGGGDYHGGGGGAGGYRNSYLSETSGRNSSSESGLSLQPPNVYTITVGGGGAGGPSQAGNSSGTNGGNSVISGTGITTVTSLGGGGGGTGNLDPGTSGKNGGSGGGEGQYSGVGFGRGTGTAGQGGDGGFIGGSAPHYGCGAGGGAGGNAGAASTTAGGNGGPGLASSISGPSVTRGGGGGGSSHQGGTPGSGGSGGGAAGSSGQGGSATSNTGGGGGGSERGPASPGGAGGKGIVILRMPTANYSGTTTGSPTVGTSGSDTILTFNDSGSYTA